MNLGEFFIKLGVDAETGKIGQFDKALKDMTLSSVATIAGLIGISLEFEKLFRHSIDTADSLTNFRNETGLSMQELQKWSRVVRAAGGDSKSAESAFSSLLNKINLIKLGKASPESFYYLGINDYMTKTPFQIMMQLRNILQSATKENRAMKLGFMRDLGINQDMIAALSLSDKDFNIAMGDSMNLTDEQIDKLHKLSVNMHELKTQFDYTADSLMASLNPAFDALGKKIDAALKSLLEFSKQLDKGTPFTKFKAGVKSAWDISMIVPGVNLAGTVMQQLKSLYPNNSQVIYNLLTLTPEQLDQLPKEQQKKYLNNLLFHALQGTDNDELMGGS